jgi:hypothetical protein
VAKPHRFREIKKTIARIETSFAERARSEQAAGAGTEAASKATGSKATGAGAKPAGAKATGAAGAKTTGAKTPEAAAPAPAKSQPRSRRRRPRSRPLPRRRRNQELARRHDDPRPDDQRPDDPGLDAREDRAEPPQAPGGSGHLGQDAEDDHGPNRASEQAPSLRQVHPPAHAPACHDEKREAKVGDLVEIMETRPLSKIKRWRLTRVIEKAPAV